MDELEWKGPASDFERFSTAFNPTLYTRARPRRSIPIEDEERPVTRKCLYFFFFPAAGGAGGGILAGGITPFIRAYTAICP